MEIITTNYLTIYAKGSTEILKPVLDDLSSFSGKVYISWRNTSPLYKTSFNYDKCMDLEFPSTKHTVKFILNFYKKLNITKENLLDLVACVITDNDEPTIETVKRQLEIQIKDS